MATIIPFPKNPGNFKEVERLISEVGQRLGLTNKQVELVAQEYQQYYDELFNAGNIIINSPQSPEIEKLQAMHNKQISHACHIIISLLIKNQMQ